MPWMNISCPKCGKESSLEGMTFRPVSGWLPPGQFQCPLCNHAFQRREVEPGRSFKYHDEQHYIQGRIGLVPCSPLL